jgi:hypothetical protein
MFAIEVVYATINEYNRTCGCNIEYGKMHTAGRVFKPYMTALVLVPMISFVVIQQLLSREGEWLTKFKSR